MPEARQSGNEREFSAPQAQSVEHELNLILASETFAGSKRCQEFLRLIVEHALAGEIDDLRERMIGVEMFGRRVDYDTSNDAVVRVRATEVRKRLGRYYAELGRSPVLRIELPSGSYVPKFHWSPSEQSTESRNEPISAPLTEESPAQEHALKVEDSPVARPALRRTPRNTAATLAALAIMAAIAYIGYKTWSKWGGSQSEIRSIAILPLQNLSGDMQQEYFADGITEELISNLGQVSALRVIAITSAMTYKGTKKSLPEIAHELRVDGLVEVSVLREGNRARIIARLIDARTGRYIWARTYTRDLTSLLALEGEVAQEIADAIKVELTPGEKTRLARARPVDAEAGELYLLGSNFLEQGDPQHALGYLQKAVENDSGFAQAYAALSHAYFSLGEDGLMAYTTAFPEAKANALKAIQLDGALPDGHLALANAVENQDWDWVTQEQELKQAIKLNPSGASVHYAYALALEKVGRTDEALAQLRIMQQIDPVSSQSTAAMVDVYYFARRYDLALEKLRLLDATNPQNISVNFWYGVIYREKGLYDQSIKALTKLADNAQPLGHLGNAFARAGRVAEARAIIPKLQEHISRDGIGTYEVALVYAGLGQKDQAFAWLEKAYAARNKGLTYLKIDPCMDPLRSDPRFEDLLRRVGLPP
jgi:TolB-like protein/cytochrome c-type biogenesis protein CcmH/NrfG